MDRRLWTNKGIRSDSKLKVHVVDAQNLNAGNYVVKIEQDGQQAETNQKDGEAPIWNEAIVFDIKDPDQPVIIQLTDKRTGEVIFQYELDLTNDDMKDYSQQGEEIWAYKSGFAIETDPKLRLRCHYSWSDVQRFNTLLEEWRFYINDAIEQLTLIEGYVDDLSSPFESIFAQVMAD